MAGVQGDLSMPPEPQPVPSPAAPPSPMPQGAGALAGMPQPDYSASDALIKGMGDPLAQTNSILSQNRAALAPREAAVQKAAQGVQQAGANVPPHPQQAAPEPQQGMGLQAAGEWVAVASVLGAIAGAMTRRSTTNALAAFTGALEGVQQGNKQAFEQNKVIWEQENKRINQQLQQQRDAYLDILNSKKTDFNTQMLLLQQEAMRQHDETMAQLAAQQKQLEIAKMLDTRENKRVEGVDAFLKMRNALQVAEIRASGGPQLLSNEAVQRQAEIQDKGGPAAKNVSKSDAARIQNARTASPEEAIRGQQQYAGDISGAKSLGPRLQNLEAVNSQLTALVPQALAASKSVGRVGVLSMDEAIQWAQTQAGNQPLKYFIMTNVQLAEQQARALKGPGVLDVGIQKMVFQQLSTAQNEGSYATAVKAIVDGVSREREGLRRLRSGQEQPTPEVPGSYTPPPLGAGGQGGGGGPKPGTVEDGYRFKGGNPADQSSWEKVQ